MGMGGMEISSSGVERMWATGVVQVGLFFGTAPFSETASHMCLRHLPRDVIRPLLQEYHLLGPRF